MKPPAHSFLGVTVHALTLPGLENLVDEAAAGEGRRVAGYHNLHSLYLYHHDPLFREFYERADYVHADGMSLVALGRLLGHPLSRENRLTSVDWLGPVLRRCSEKDLRVFFLGSKPGVAEKAATRFAREVPGLRARTRHGYFDIAPGSEENRRLVAEINAYRPHLLMVGMGMPRQERWILDNIDALDANLVWSMGAFLDYFGGAASTPPRWMGRLGLEWLYRLLSEPRRLWRRYLVEPWFVVLRLLPAELARKARERRSKERP